MATRRPRAVARRQMLRGPSADEPAAVQKQERVLHARRRLSCIQTSPARDDRRDDPLHPRRRKHLSTRTGIIAALHSWAQTRGRDGGRGRFGALGDIMLTFVLAKSQLRGERLPERHYSTFCRPHLAPQAVRPAQIVANSIEALLKLTAGHHSASHGSWPSFLARCQRAYSPLGIPGADTRAAPACRIPIAVNTTVPGRFAADRIQLSSDANLGSASQFAIRTRSCVLGITIAAGADVSVA